MDIRSSTSHLLGLTLLLQMACVACNNEVNSRTIPRLNRHNTLVELSITLTQLIEESDGDESWWTLAKTAAEKLSLSQSRDIVLVSKDHMSFQQNEYIVWCDSCHEATSPNAGVLPLIVNVAPIAKKDGLFEVLLKTLDGHELFRIMTRKQVEHMSQISDPSDVYHFMQSVPVSSE